MTICRFTPLHEAANFGFLEYVQELHKANANLNMKSHDGVTPLITAAANGHLEIIEYLLDAGAKLCIQVRFICPNLPDLVDFLNSFLQGYSFPQINVANDVQRWLIA